jgi:glycogen synthase
MNGPGSAPRLLWLTDAFHPAQGGMARSCDRIVHGLRSCGIYVATVHFCGPGHSSVKEAKVNGEHIRFPVENDLSDAAMRVWERFRESWQGRGFTHVVVFGGINAVLAGPVFAAWLGCRLVTLLRGNDFDAAVMSPRRQGTLFRALERSWRAAAVTSDMAARMSALVPALHVEWIPNGIDLDEWKISDSDKSNGAAWRKGLACGDRTVIGIAGHLKAKKGVPFFLECCRVAGCADRFCFALIGDCDQGTREYLATARDLCIRTEPFMDSHGLRIRYCGCDAVAIPSFYDGMPNVMLEASACRRPIIAARVGGMADALRDGENGILFTSGDPATAAAALHRFDSLTPAARATMGDCAYETVACRFSATAEIESYRRFFNEELLHDHGVPR